jgi:magnesium chelatase family protein
MTSRTYSVAFQGIDAQQVEIQCALAAGVPGFTIVGLPDKAVSEARDRIRSALTALGIALPPKRITVNLSPADLPKEGSHFDLPITLAILAAMNVIPPDRTKEILSMGELTLDGQLRPVPGALPAAVCANSHEQIFLCPAQCGPEAAWSGMSSIVAASGLDEVIRHFTSQITLPVPEINRTAGSAQSYGDFAEVKGQERAKRALEIAAAGRHHILMVGPPGSGKSMLAARLPGLLPPLSPEETLETTMIHSLSGLLVKGEISRTRPFRAPHHTASMAAIAGGGRGAKPGEVSLAHNGVLFLDELPEFSRNVLDTLRQPLETGQIVVARANAHATYPCRFMLIAAANPCRCGHLADANKACNRAPACADKYIGKVSGPMMDRFDLRVEIPPVDFRDLDLPNATDNSEKIAARVATAYSQQQIRYKNDAKTRHNAEAEGATLDRVARPDQDGKALLIRAADQFGLTARGYHRVLRVARTIADLDQSDAVCRHHIAEALSFRMNPNARG